jgi:hypothetical protein
MGKIRFTNQMKNPDVLESNIDHIKAAEIASQFKPNNDFVENDNYYKHPKDEKDRSYENIRQGIIGLEKLRDVIPEYEKSGTYHVREDGVGEILTYKHLIEILTGQMAYYTYKYNQGYIPKEISLLINELQEHKSIFETQLNGLISEDKEGNKQSSNQKINTILHEPKYTLTRDLEAKYGKDWAFTSEATDWFNWCRHTSVSDAVQNEISNMHSREQNEYYKEEMSKYRSAVAKTENYAHYQNLHTLTESLDTALLITPLNLDDYQLRKIPETSEAIIQLRAVKQLAVTDLYKTTLQHHEQLHELDDDQLKQVLTLLTKYDEKKAAEVTRILLTESPVSRIGCFVKHELDSYFPLDISDNVLAATRGQNSLSKEKSTELHEALLNITLEKIPDLMHSEIESNVYCYRLLLEQFYYLKEDQPEKLRSVLAQVVTALPSHVQFISNHPLQMNKYLVLLDCIANEIIVEGDVGEAAKEHFIQLLTDTDKRYPQITGKFTTIKQKLLQHFKTYEK